MTGYHYTPGRCVACAELVDPDGFNAAGRDWCPTCWTVYAEKRATALPIWGPTHEAFVDMQPRYFVELYGKWTTRENAWRVLACDYWQTTNRVPVFVPVGWGFDDWTQYIARSFPRVEHLHGVQRIAHYAKTVSREFMALRSATVTEVLGEFA